MHTLVFTAKIDDCYVRGQVSSRTACLLLPNFQCRNRFICGRGGHPSATGLHCVLIDERAFKPRTGRRPGMKW
ncbi:hypothetical protein [Sodalis sp.]|uniref:hypothetical protein n=1 Tax=Sodalis sp. (in: enterobacteria) TaxID=1898979 RepID=UPI003872DB48